MWRLAQHAVFGHGLLSHCSPVLDIVQLPVCTATESGAGVCSGAGQDCTCVSPNTCDPTTQKCKVRACWPCREALLKRPRCNICLLSAMLCMQLPAQHMIVRSARLFIVLPQPGLSTDKPLLSASRLWLTASSMQHLGWRRHVLGDGTQLRLWDPCNVQCQHCKVPGTSLRRPYCARDRCCCLSISSPETS